MAYEPDRIRKEFITEIKKAKSKKDSEDITYKFVLDRVGRDRKVGEKEKNLISKLEKAIPKRKRCLLKDFLKYRTQIELATTINMFIRTVNFLIDYGNIITEILSEAYGNYTIQYEKANTDIDA